MQIDVRANLPVPVPTFERNGAPEELQLGLWNDQLESYSASYTIDEDLRRYTDDVLRKYRPDYRGFYDGRRHRRNARVLELSKQRRLESSEKASYPAASVFKIVTATAAVDKYG